MSSARIIATYRLQGPATAVDARAQALALEQSVEMPLEAVTDHRVRDEVVARVVGVRPLETGVHEVQLAIAAETTGSDAGQLLNMLFGNSSLHDDVTLFDFECDDAYAAAFGGPRHGIAGLRTLTGAQDRPLTCSALKPQGMSPAALARLAGTFAQAGIDIVKDDHGLADQASAPFALRVPACQAAVDAANATTGGHTRYAPSLSGSLDAMRAQLRIAHDCGVRVALIAPMLAGVSNLTALVRDARMPLIAHPALAGAARIAPPLLLGKLFRLFGADATIFPNAGGRFAYSPATCRAIAGAARDPWHGLAPALPVPAGGMTVERVAELRASFGNDVMLLIGGSLLQAGHALDARCRAFVAAVADTEGVAR